VCSRVSVYVFSDINCGRRHGVREMKAKGNGYLVEQLLVGWFDLRNMDNWIACLSIGIRLLHWRQWILTKMGRAKWAGQAVSMKTWETRNGILTLKKSSDESTRFLITLLKQTWKRKDKRVYAGFNWLMIRSSAQLNDC
jgi:hypothetical protein